MLSSQGQKIVRADLSYAAILVVDDMVTNLDVLKGMLAPYKIKIDCVTSGEQAIQCVKEEKTRYNIILMDHLMPSMDGIEVVKIIRNEIGGEYAKTVPIIALTANAFPENEATFLESGFNAFISKPIGVRKLDDLLNCWVKNENSFQQEQATPSSYTSGDYIKNLKIHGLNVSNGLSRMGDNADSYLAILRSFASHAPDFLKTVRTGNSANANNYRIAVHGIKGSSWSIGAIDLGDRAERLEKAAKNGEVDFIESNNAAFVRDVEKLISDINNFMQEMDTKASRFQKPEIDVPDPKLINAVLEACKQYDIAALTKAIEALDAYTYRSWPGMIRWLKVQADYSNFEEIINRLKE